MTAAEGRRWVIKVSFTAVAVHGVVLVLAPAILPLLGQVHLRWEDALRLVETVSPTFVSFLGMGAMYAVQMPTPETPSLAPEQRHMISLMLKGSVALFAAVDIASFTAFIVSNRPSATEAGLSFEGLSHILASSLSILAVTTNVIVVWLFRVAPAPGEPA